MPPLTATRIRLSHVYSSCACARGTGCELSSGATGRIPGAGRAGLAHDASERAYRVVLAACQSVRLRREPPGQGARRGRLRVDAHERLGAGGPPEHEAVLELEAQAVRIRQPCDARAVEAAREAAGQRRQRGANAGPRRDREPAAGRRAVPPRQLGQAHGERRLRQRDDLGEQAAREDRVLVAGEGRPGEAAALLAGHVGAARGERFRQVLEADRPPLAREAVVLGDALDQRARRHRDRHAARHAPGPREMVHEQREHLGLREDAAVRVHRGDAVGVAVGGEAEAEAARRPGRAAPAPRDAPASGRVRSRRTADRARRAAAPPRSRAPPARGRARPRRSRGWRRSGSAGGARAGRGPSRFASAAR